MFKCSQNFAAGRNQSSGFRAVFLRWKTLHLSALGEAQHLGGAGFLAVCSFRQNALGAFLDVASFESV